MARKGMLLDLGYDCRRVVFDLRGVGLYISHVSMSSMITFLLDDDGPIGLDFWEGIHLRGNTSANFGMSNCSRSVATFALVATLASAS